jgi:hypothetical protein
MVALLRLDSLLAPISPAVSPKAHAGSALFDIRTHLRALRLIQEFVFLKSGV